MIVERLEVKHFRRVRDADLALGAGLNVIHGPNDLGKSTLAEAVRAALLLRSNAKEAERLIPWDDAEAQPFVRLTFRDADGVRWRVQKRFGRSGAQGSLLERDERGQWSVAAKGREVDGVLRERFRLGLPQPGGRGGPRGIPDTFLARALLGHQGEAIQLFGSGVEGDPDDSGRAWLEETMASYARDETFDRVLQEARAKVAEAYTGKGNRSGAAGTPFGEAAERVRAALDAERAARGALDDAEETRATLRARREALRAAGAAVGDAQRALRMAEAAAHRQRLESSDAARAQAEERVRALETQAERHAARASAREERRAKIAAAEAKVQELDRALARARAGAAVADHHAAVATFERATTAKGAAAGLSDLAERAATLVELRALRAERARLAERAAEAAALTETATEREREAAALTEPPPPDAAALAAAEEAARADERARARLEVGLRLELDLGVGVAAYLVDEGGERTAGEVVDAASEVLLELRQDDAVLARIRARAGDPSLHDEAERARAALVTALEPLRRTHGLDTAGPAALTALRTLAREGAERLREATERRAEAARLREKAAALAAGDTEELDGRIAHAVDAVGEVEEVEAALGEGDPEAFRAAARQQFAEADAALRDAERRVTAAEARAQTSRENLEGDEEPSAESVDESQSALGVARAALADLREADAEPEADAVELNAALRAAREALTERRTVHAGLLATETEPFDEAHLDAAPSVDDARASLVETEAAERALRDEVARLEGRAERLPLDQAQRAWERAKRALTHAEEAEAEVGLEYEGWRRLVEALEASAARMGRDLGATLVEPVRDRFDALLRSVGGAVERYGGLAFGADASTEGAVVDGEVRELEALSMGTREQLATLLRLTLAERLGTFLVLDDHLTHSDGDRTRVLGELMRQVAKDTQLIVFTCHPERYLAERERDAATDRLTAIDAGRLLRSE